MTESEPATGRHSILHAVRVVLYEPQDPINIGATIRAMKNMGARDLRLVRPCDYEPNRIEQVAHDTRDLVARIRHFHDLDSALDDCVRVHAYAGKRRAAKWRRMEPRASAADLLEYLPDAPVALLFGREDHGLPNEALDRAQVVVTIPTTEHMSLNLAQAVLVALYELHVLAGDATRHIGRHRRHAPASTHEQQELTFADIERSLRAMDFFRTRNPEHVMRSMRSLLYRASPDAREIELVRAMAIEVRRAQDRLRRELGGEPAEEPPASTRESRVVLGRDGGP